MKQYSNLVYDQLHRLIRDCNYPTVSCKADVASVLLAQILHLVQSDKQAHSRQRNLNVKFNIVRHHLYSDSQSARIRMPSSAYTWLPARLPYFVALQATPCTEQLRMSHSRLRSCVRLSYVTRCSLSSCQTSARAHRSRLSTISSCDGVFAKNNSTSLVRAAGNVKIDVIRPRWRWYARSRTEGQSTEAVRMVYELHLLYTSFQCTTICGRGEGHLCV